MGNGKGVEKQRDVLPWGPGVTFQALPRISVLFILWAADNEFPAKVNILFDPAIEDHFALDTIWGLTRVATFKRLEF